MDTENGDPGWVDLSEAIEALRSALVRAWWDGQRKRVRFRIEPVELTVKAGVTRTGKGAAGIKWHILSLGAERSREFASTQELRLRLAPILFDDQGKPLAETEQLISDRDDDMTLGTPGRGEEVPHEPA